MLRKLKKVLNVREHLRVLCAHFFPKDILFHELTRVLEEQRRRVINCDDNVLRAKSEASLEKARLANFERYHSKLRGNLVL
jgi:hypothetical protein